METGRNANMNALILNGALKNQDNLGLPQRNIQEVLTHAGYNVEAVQLHEQDIAKCTGCFGCWVKTPGVCVIDDYGRNLAEKMIKADVLIWLTPVVFGGYSSELKKALDRMICLMLPFFKKVQGEVHHKERYKNFPKVIVLGTMERIDTEQEEIFLGLIKRNSLNLHNQVSGGVVKTQTDDQIKSQILKYLNIKEVAAC